MIRYWITLVCLFGLTQTPTAQYVNTCENRNTLYWDKSVGLPHDDDGYYEYDDEATFYIYRGSWVSSQSDNVAYVCSKLSGWTHTLGINSFDDCYVKPTDNCWDYRPGEARWKIHMLDTYGDGWGAPDANNLMDYSGLFIYILNKCHGYIIRCNSMPELL